MFNNNPMNYFIYSVSTNQDNFLPSLRLLCSLVTHAFIAGNIQSILLYINILSKSLVVKLNFSKPIKISLIIQFIKLN